MENPHGIKITKRDRVFRAWENSMELVRDYEAYSQSIEDDSIAKLFAEYAEDEGVHAAKLLEILRKLDKGQSH